MAFTIYKSTDGSAPVLTGETDSLCVLLQAVLVDGYGAKAAAGWTREFDGTSKSVYRPGAGSRFYYRIDDAGPGAGTFKEARVVGYETMTDVDTGLLAFPTAAQLANGLFIRKSATADATARAWKIFADSRTAYVFIITGDAANPYLGFMLGDFYSLVAGDLYNAAIIARATENSATTSVDNLDKQVSSPAAASVGSYMARGHTGLGSAVLFSRGGDYYLSNGNSSFGVVPLPTPADSSIRLGKWRIGDPTTAPVGGLRGYMRGFWHWLHPIAGVNDGDTFTGAGDLSSKTFEIVKPSGSTGLYVMETSDTLETN